MVQGLIEFDSVQYSDERGTFLNVFRSHQMPYKQIWSAENIKQINISLTKSIGTIRGIHCQRRPYGDKKIVRCIKGKVMDVIVDLRNESPTFGQWKKIELSQAKCNAICIPEGCGHGFQVLEENSEILYIHSGEWKPEYESGVIFNDATLAIDWPLTPVGLSIKDKNLPNLQFWE